VIPKGEYVSVEDFSEAASDTEISAFVRAIALISRAEGISESGYRILSNHGPAAHPEVPHFHLHIFGGRTLGAMLPRRR